MAHKVFHTNYRCYWTGRKGRAVPVSTKIHCLEGSLSQGIEGALVSGIAAAPPPSSTNPHVIINNAALTSPRTEVLHLNQGEEESEWCLHVTRRIGSPSRTGSNDPVHKATLLDSFSHYYLWAWETKKCYYTKPRLLIKKSKLSISKIDLHIKLPYKQLASFK